MPLSRMQLFRIYRAIQPNAFRKERIFFAPPFHIPPPDCHGQGRRLLPKARPPLPTGRKAARCYFWMNDPPEDVGGKTELIVDLDRNDQFKELAELA